MGALTRDEINAQLTDHHYLGPTQRGRHFYTDAVGILVFGPPAARNLPSAWLELQRWCIIDRTPNSGSQSWSRCVEWLRGVVPGATTVVSYSDPGAGHNGALYRACNWLWAPTWHRIVTPPTGLGSWVKGVKQEAKDRWVYPLAPDADRLRVLELGATYQRRWPGVSYVEPVWKHGRPILQTGGGKHTLLRAVHENIRASRAAGERCQGVAKGLPAVPPRAGGSTPPPRSTSDVIR